jgi:polyol permease family/HAD superfamily hydrolase (TIGR01549 family)
MLLRASAQGPAWVTYGTMVSASEVPRSIVGRASFLERFPFPRRLFWGYLGLLLFMIGDGIESGYLAPFLLTTGLSHGRVGAMFSIYGIAAAIGSRSSGILSDLWGPRRVMWMGLVFWGLFQILFLLFGIPDANFPMMLVAYGLRGLGYPLFAYGFLVWIVNTTSLKNLGSAVGWFWFAFTGGMPTLGSFLASFLIPVLGQYGTLWSALGFVLAGGFVTLFGVSEIVGLRRLLPAGNKSVDSFFSSIAIAWQKPKTTIGCIVRMLSTAPQFGFLVFLPTFYTQTIGFSLSAWLRLLSYMFLSNIVWNLFMGFFGDRLGWRRTVAYIGGLGCAVATLLLYYVPSTFRDHYWLSVLVAAIYGAALAGNVPLSAIMPSLVPENKGAAISMLNLGAAAAAWLGPMTVAIFIGPLGVGGVIWIFAILHAVAGLMALFLTLPPEIEEAIVTSRAGQPVGVERFAASGLLLANTPAIDDELAENDIALVLFDLGGTIYDDDTYTRALLRAVRQMNPSVKEEQFWAVYDGERGRGAGSLRTAIANRFVSGNRAGLVSLAKRYWEYPSSALYPDVKPTLTVLASKFKLGLVANSGEAALRALRRDGLHELFDVIALADFVGVEKPDTKIFQYALEKAGIPANRTVHVGNRLESDIRPAKSLGLRAVWVLRGDAPPAPTLNQLAEPDAVITSLIGLPVALSRLMHMPGHSSDLSPK